MARRGELDLDWIDPFCTTFKLIWIGNDVAGKNLVHIAPSHYRYSERHPCSEADDSSVAPATSD